MQIEEGKTYRTRDGQKVGPMVAGQFFEGRPLMGVVNGCMGRSYWGDGHEYAGETRGTDLIEEWSEPEAILAQTSIPELMQDLRDAEQPHKLTIDDIENHNRDAHAPVPDGTNDEYAGYTALADVLNDAYWQAAHGKGKKRHSQGKPFLEQPILEIPRMQNSIDGLTYQVMKKAQESGRMLGRGQYNSAVAELYGIINYAAAAVIRVREIETEAGNLDASAE